MADDAFVSCSRSRDNIHPVPTRGLVTGESCADYEETLKRFYGAETLDADLPLFDVTLLGIGEDGHTALIISGHSIRCMRRDDGWLQLATKSRRTYHLTYPALESSREVAFMVAGAEKRTLSPRAQAGDVGYPRPLCVLSGVCLFMDRSAHPQEDTDVQENQLGKDTSRVPRGRDRHGCFGLREIHNRSACRFNICDGV